jgi:flavin-dependent dehydrogenase
VIDVVIAGAGPAGSALAILLGRAGLSVRLHERHRFPREKACAEGIMPAGVAVLQRLGLDAAIGGAPFAGVRYHGFGLQIGAAFPDASQGRGQRRLRLDAALFEAARTTPGVDTCQGAAVDGLLFSGDRVAGVTAGGQSVRARLVVAADGPRSLVRRQAGLDGRARRSPRLGLRAHFRLAAGKPVPPLVEVFVAAGREIYVTPLPDGQVAVAALTAEHDGNARALFPRWTAEHPALAALLEGAEQITELAGQMPLESRARAGVRPGLALIGDAAGFIDPVTGSGMAQALVSAELLATQVARAPGVLDAAWERLEEFDRRRRLLLRDGALLTRVVLALASRPALARPTLRLMHARPSLYQHLVAVAGGVRPLLP